RSQTRCRRKAIQQGRHRGSRRYPCEDRTGMYDVVREFPKMKVGVETRGKEIVGIRYLPPEANIVRPRNALAEKAARQLERYRDDPETVFDLPLRLEGSELQRAVW